MNLFNTVIIIASTLSDISDRLNELIRAMWAPLLAVFTTLTAVWGIYLGIKYISSAGDEQKRAAAKRSIVSFFVGILVIFIVAVIAPMMIAFLSDWMAN